MIPIIPLKDPHYRLEKNNQLITLKNTIKTKLSLSNNPLLIHYINSILNLNYKDLMKIYLNSNNSFKTLFAEDLPNGFPLLKDFKNIPGIYYFLSKEGQSYLGSTQNLWRRIVMEHKTRPFNKQLRKRHSLFYNHVFKHGWTSYHLFILALIPDHLATFILISPGISLTKEEQILLETFTFYHLTLVEQFFIDHLNPSLNGDPFANFSSSNIGATGVIRSKEFREYISLLHIGRTYHQITKDLHRSNRLGIKLKEETKIKMSKSHGGVFTYIMDLNTSKVTIFKTKSSAGIALNVSIRTLTRWAKYPSRIYTVKNSSFSKIRVSFSPFEYNNPL